MMRSSSLARRLSRQSLSSLAIPLAFGASVVHAQSNVTLYGSIDASLNYVSNQNGAHSYQAQNGMINGTRWGMKGTEDLGGGTSAIFQLENGFNLFNGKQGQGAREFGRQAWLGLKDNQFGSLTLGRQYDPTIWYLAVHTGGFTGGTAFAHPFDNDNMGNSFRIDNSVMYTSPSWNGLSMRTMYAFSNQAGAATATANRAYSAGVGYDNGPLSLGAAFIVINNVGANAGGAVDGSSNSGDSTFVAGKQSVFGFGGSYIWGKGTYGATWTRTLVSNGSSVNLFGYKPMGDASLRMDNFDVNVTYNAATNITLIGSYAFTMGRYESATTSASPKWHQVNLQAAYYFSKRTDVYIDAVYQHVIGGTGTPFANAILCGYAQSSTPTQIVVGLGMRHRF
ncbi:porin [Pandoraea fibrosis]|uniref:Porin n=1 Tax=Pandoraea fibrosis TaxID=1891094 RepID=A0ABX6HQP5_9BURK|nr:porin [Pandoraea fibrosis]QHE93219.1 porin [Pandoraea fibrosis]QHF13222.1 porin [Pandoraea fibrosis]